MSTNVLSLLTPDPGPAPEPEYLRRYYAVELTRPKASTLRLQLYEVVEGELRQLWPADSHHGRRAVRLPMQVFSMNEGYPPFHFRIERGYAEPLKHLARELAAHFRCRVIVKPIGNAHYSLAMGDALP